MGSKLLKMMSVMHLSKATGTFLLKIQIVISISFVLAESISGATPMSVIQAWKVPGQSQEKLSVLVPAAFCLAEN